MKSRYRIIARRRVEGARRVVRLRRDPLDPVMDDPFDMPSELVDVATGDLVDERPARPGRGR